MESLFTFLESMTTYDILLYIGLFLEGIGSYILWKKSGKPKTTAQVVDKDINALIDYHEKVASELRKKNNFK